jgi:hypothetical protein
VRTAAVRRQRKHEPLRARLTRNNDFLMSVPKRFPNVFFHVLIAYDILRHNGVDLGKRDFLDGGRDW